MNETSLLNNIFKLRAKKIDRFATEAEAIQHRVLMDLVQKAADTEWGSKHKYADIRGYEDFASNVAVQDYESLKGYIERMRQGESDVLCRAVGMPCRLEQQTTRASSSPSLRMD